MTDPIPRQLPFSLSDLQPPWAKLTDAIEVECLRQGLPMEPCEGKRRLARQNALGGTGFTNAKGLESAHPWGLATDWRLILGHAYWKAALQGPVAHDDGGAAWDTGVVIIGGRASIQRPVVLSVWDRFGHIVADVCGVPFAQAAQVWGGAWFKLGTSRGSHLLGWDAGHTQMPGWSVLARSLPTPVDPS